MNAQERLWEKVIGHASRRGLDPRLALPVAAVAVTLLGVGQPSHRVFLETLAASQHPVANVRALLETLTDAVPYLAGHLDPLTDLLRDPDDDRFDVTAGEMFTTMAAADLPALAATNSVGGDLLGPLYTVLMAPGDRSGRGAFYTPPDLAAVIAMFVEPKAGERCYEPCVGTGGLIIATVRVMRARGSCPELVHWVIGDIDRTALALAGIQLAALGLPSVRLVPGNALSP